MYMYRVCDVTATVRVIFRKKVFEILLTFFFGFSSFIALKRR